jgi:hypothetical protein
MSGEREANRERERERCYQKIEGKMSGEREAVREKEREVLSGD